MNRGGMDGIDPKGLRGFRPERRKSLEPDETEGRMIYRPMAEPPVCALCSGRHWFLDACIEGERHAEKDAAQAVATKAPVHSKAGPLAATATPDEIERALKLYRKKREQARDRMRKKRAAHHG